MRKVILLTAMILTLGAGVIASSNSLPVIIAPATGDESTFVGFEMPNRVNGAILFSSTAFNMYRSFKDKRVGTDGYEDYYTIPANTSFHVPGVLDSIYVASGDSTVLIFPLK